MTEIRFLGTGNFSAYDRYWNGFVVDGRVLVEPSPAVVPHLRRVGLSAADLEVVVISHFHPDHSFGWPFLLLELLEQRQGAETFVVGPPGVEGQLDAMMRLGGMPNVADAARDGLDLRYVEVDGTWQRAGSIRFRGVEVEHVPWLECFGYLLEIGGRTLGYSGDVRPCPGLDEVAGNCEALVLECNGPHPEPKVHMDQTDVAGLRARFPEVPFVLTHLGPGISAVDVDRCTVPSDFETIEV
jgi:ribonuclease Z